MEEYRGLQGDASGKIKADEGVSPALNLHSFGCCEQTSRQDLFEEDSRLMAEQIKYNPGGRGSSQEILIQHK